MAKLIGPTFSAELAAAGLIGLPFSWGSDGVIQFGSDMTQTQINAVNTVYAAHDPTKLDPTAVEISAETTTVKTLSLPTPAQIDTFVANTFPGLTSAQQAFLARLAKIVRLLAINDGLGAV